MKFLIYLLRHGEALERGFADAERPLSPSGERQSRVVGRFLRASLHAPSIILASPLLRAKRTAEIVGAEVGVTDIFITKSLIPGFGERELVDELDAHGATPVLLVGHEPQLMSFLARITGDLSPDIRMRTGTLVCMECDLPIAQGGGVLKWVRSNEELESLIRSGG